MKMDATLKDSGLRNLQNTDRWRCLLTKEMKTSSASVTAILGKRIQSSRECIVEGAMVPIDYGLGEIVCSRSFVWLAGCVPSWSALYIVSRASCEYSL